MIVIVHERAPFADRLGHGAVFDVSGMAFSRISFAMFSTCSHDGNAPRTFTRHYRSSSAGLPSFKHSNAKRAWHSACLLQVFSISSMAHTND